MTRAFTHDLYSPLAHIPVIGDGHTPTTGRLPGLPTWIPDADIRRQTAYRVLAAMRDNCRRFYYPDDMWVDQRATQPDVERLRVADRPAAAKVREYGHAGLLTDTGRALVLGEDQTVTLPDLTGRAADDVDADTVRLRKFHDWLTGWAVKERLTAALMLGEENTVGDGDGVYVLAWDTDRNRPRLKTFDPGFFFPDQASMDDPAYASPEGLPWGEEYPPVVHLAWEYEDAQGVQWLRRTTWRMERLPAPVAARWTDQDGAPASRAWTCISEVSEWVTTNIPGDQTIYTLNPDRHRGVRRVPPTDLLIDFIPVVHIPNDEPGDRFFGRSLLLRVAQILDDIMGSDTDLAVTSETVANAPVVLTGAGSAPLDAGPGQQWNLPAGGTAAVMDTSKALTAGMEYSRKLRDDLAISARMGLALLGQVSPKDVPSGYALQLGFAPANRLKAEMRAVREHKHALLLKFALRMAQAAAVLDSGPTPAAVIDLGASLPSDRAAAVDEVKALLPAHAISRKTAVRMLAAAGLPIEDAEDEVRKIAEEAFADAVALVDATGRVDLALDRLGLSDVPDPTPQPVPGPTPAPVPDPGAVPGDPTGGNQ